MRIEMKSQNAYIGIKREDSKQSIEQPKAEVKISNKHAQVRVEATLPKVQIDQKQAFAESGLKGILQLSSDNSDEAMSRMAANISKKVEEGNQLANIKNNVDAIAEMAFNNSTGKSKDDFNMVTMPKSGATIDVIEGTIDISVDEGSAEITVDTKKPILDYTPGKIETYIRQKNSLEITVVNDKFDEKV
ncbi:MAG: DUF6470 family protein [Acidaminobacteraceae bacterium]